MDASAAQKRWELENDVQEVENVDQLFKYDPREQRHVQQLQPWKQNPHYFTKVKVSALALLKMAMHAKSGGRLEVMGVLQGKVAGDTFVVLDTFPLPVEGTETRVNAQQEAYEYMVGFKESSERVGRREQVVGWYHSHPGYGCWLSGIDVSTQLEQQEYQDPFLAIVVDPVMTSAAGKVEIGAFRTYPKGYTPPDEPQSEYQSIPLSKIEDFGVHAKHYYPLEVSFFKSPLDKHMLEVLWGKHWVSTLTASPVLGAGGASSFVTAQIRDAAQKVELAEQAAGSRGGVVGRGKDGMLDRAVKDARKIAIEFSKAQKTQEIRQQLFGSLQPCSAGPQATS
ncbi:unnamed protein product [Pedinophyceae sp. YPF-701]|nr:unnamed protein product [Pedinophyceae sp. YPF-701]